MKQHHLPLVLLLCLVARRPWHRLLVSSLTITTKLSRQHFDVSSRRNSQWGSCPFGCPIRHRHHRVEHAIVPVRTAVALRLSSPLPQQPSDESSSSFSSASITEASSSSSSTTTAIQANLKRKVVAKRPLLGHVVPKANRMSFAKPTTAGGSSQPELRLQGIKNVKNDHAATRSLPSSSSNLKIMGGSQKGRRLDSPQFVYLRPMMAKVKEAVFSTLTSMGVYDNMYRNNHKHCRHLDLYAGSGSVGLESLSRGATHCTFCDFSLDCCQTIQRNYNKCLFDDNTDPIASTTTTIIQADVMDLLQQPLKYTQEVPYSIVTICPPYEEVIYADLLQAAIDSPLVSDDTIVVVEYPIELQTLPHVVNSKSSATTTSSSSANNDHNQHQRKAMIGIRNRRYGRTVIAMYICNPTGALEFAISRPEEFVFVK